MKLSKLGIKYRKTIELKEDSKLNLFSFPSCKKQQRVKNLNVIGNNKTLTLTVNHTEGKVVLENCKFQDLKLVVYCQKYHELNFVNCVFHRVNLILLLTEGSEFTSFEQCELIDCNSSIVDFRDSVKTTDLASINLIKSSNIENTNFFLFSRRSTFLERLIGSYLKNDTIKFVLFYRNEITRPLFINTVIDSKISNVLVKLGGSTKYLDSLAYTIESMTDSEMYNCKFFIKLVSNDVQVSSFFINSLRGSKIYNCFVDLKVKTKSECQENFSLLFYEFYQSVCMNLKMSSELEMPDDRIVLVGYVVSESALHNLDVSVKLHNSPKRVCLMGDEFVNSMISNSKYTLNNVKEKIDVKLVDCLFMNSCMSNTEININETKKKFIEFTDKTKYYNFKLTNN